MQEAIRVVTVVPGRRSQSASVKAAPVHHFFDLTRPTLGGATGVSLIFFFFSFFCLGVESAAPASRGGDLT